MTARGATNLRRPDEAGTPRQFEDGSATPALVLAESSTELSQWVMSRRSHHPQVASFIAPFNRGAGTVESVSAAVLAGLGKRPDLYSLKRPAEPLASAWMLNGAATDVLVFDAQRIAGWLVPDVAAWLCNLGVRPWFIYCWADNGFDSGEHRSTRRVLRETADAQAARWGVEVLDESALRAAFKDSPKRKQQPPKPPKRPSGLPLLPRVDGVVFRSACRDLLPAEQAQLVDARFVATVRHLRERCRIERRRGGNGRVRLAEMLRRVLADTSDTEEFVLTARAAQVAMLNEGWLLRINAIQMVASADTRPRPGVATAAGVWDRFDAYRDPDLGVAAGLYEAGVALEDFPVLTLGDVEDDGHVVRVKGLEVRPECARYVRVLVSFRQLCGAVGSDSLFSTHRADSIRPLHAYTLLHKPLDELEAHTSDKSFGRRPPAADEWLKRHGIVLEALGNLKTATDARTSRRTRTKS